MKQSQNSFILWSRTNNLLNNFEFDKNMKKASMLNSSPSKNSNKLPGYPSKAKAANAAANVNDTGIVNKPTKSKTSSGTSPTGPNTGNVSDSGPGLALEDSFEKYYNKDLDLEEDQVPVVIYELNESALNFISQEQYEKALILLQKAQTMLDQIQAEKIECDQFIFLLTLHNMAMCYQKLGILEECSICLEACIDHLDSEYLQKYFSNPDQPSLRLKMLKYKCKTHMQICALLSQIHKHKEAVFHSNSAIKIAHYLLNECKNQCEFYVTQLTKRREGSSQSQWSSLHDISIISDARFSLLEKTSVKLLPILIEIQKKMAIEDYRTPSEGGIYITGPVKLAKAGRGSISPQRRGNVGPPGAQQHPGGPPGYHASTQPGKNFYDCGQSDMKNILGYLNQSEWVYSLNIGNIMQISPLTLQDFLSHTALQLELSREFILEKMCFLAVSYFCMGTEYRFLHQLKEKIQEQTFERRDSEYWHGKAVEMAITFLPSESPLVSHILMSYEKHHSPSNMVIPENESQDKFIRIVRQSHGIDSCRLQPIIRHHADGEYRVPRIDFQKINYHKLFRTEEYLKTVRLVNKKQLQALGGNPKNNLNITSRHVREDEAARGAKIQAQNSQDAAAELAAFNRQLTLNSNMEDAKRQSLNADHVDGQKRRKQQQEVISIDEEGAQADTDLACYLAQQDSDDDVVQKRLSDEEEGDERQANMQKTPSQDMFYKNSQNQTDSHSMLKDALKFSKQKSDGKQRDGQALQGKANHHHSQSMTHAGEGRKKSQDAIDSDSQAALPPQFDKNILQQHRNSADSGAEFNNKAVGHRKLRPASKNQILTSDPSRQKKTNKDSAGPTSKMLLTECLIDGGTQVKQGNENSSSLDELEFLGQEHQDGNAASNSATAGQHRRARSSLGVNRKASAKGSGGKQLPQNKKASNSQNRGAMLAQIREKNSSSAMAQLQPRGGEGGAKSSHLEDEDIPEDLMQNGNTYLSNNQSQPLSILGPDNQLALQNSQKARGGQSHQQMGTKKGAHDADAGVKRQFKTNPNILSANNEDGDLALENSATNPMNKTQTAQEQFMGKRNQHNQIQQTAPAAAPGQRKKQANTINVDDLQGANGSTVPQTVTFGQGGPKQLPAGQAPIHAGSVRGGAMQLSKPHMQQLPAGTVSGTAMGSGPSNNGFVASTANIDQSSKNTINVYQFGQGVNFNLKLAPGQNNAQNMSRKQYEQIQNALDQMNSLERQDRLNGSIEEKLVETTPGQIGLKNQISQSQATSQSNKQYPTVNSLAAGNNANFVPVGAASTSSKRSQKLNSSGQAPGGPGSQNSQRRKGNSQTVAKNNFNVANQYLTNQVPATGGGLTAAQTNLMNTAQSDIMSMVKKREKMNNSALAQLGGPDAGSRKFQTSGQLAPGTSGSMFNQTGKDGVLGSAQVTKIYNQKHTKSGSGGAEGGSNSQKSRRQHSTDKTMNWTNQNLNTTGGSANSAQAGASRKQGGSLGSRKTSHDNKFNHPSFGTSHHRQFSDISQQNLVGYKGIGSNLGGAGSIGDGPSVSLTSKLQAHQPTMNEHQSMPIMSTSGQAQRFLGHPGSSGQSTDMITQIPSFIQRQQQQQALQARSGVGSGSNQQKKAQAYLQNQQKQNK